jgi:hypothetical protein
MRSFFNDIKLADDFVKQGDYMQFPASTLEGDYMSIKHGIKIQRHNFPTEWMTPDLQLGGPMYYPGKAVGGPYQPPLVSRLSPPARGPRHLQWANRHPSHTIGALQGS